jgi:soluble lytic murein transglycosylase-like protein
MTESKVKENSGWGIYIMIFFTIVLAAGLYIQRDAMVYDAGIYESKINGLEMKVLKLEGEITAKVEMKHQKEAYLKEKLRASLEEYIYMSNPTVGKEVNKIIAQSIMEISENKQIEIALLVGLIKTESTFNPSAKSSAGALGLMQVMPTVWANELGITDANRLYGIRYNIEKGVEVLQHYLDKNEGNVVKALMDYNGTHTTDFSDKVLANVGKFVVYNSSN